jgi:uncharacterized repeat protein (TIGR03803 family)
MHSARTKGSLKTTLAAFSALLLSAGLTAHAQTETVLYNFTGGSDGSEPNSSLTPDGKGNFYGTTLEGGTFGDGTVFELSPNGGGWNETVLYSFTGGADGANPDFSGVIFDSAGNLYGTAYSGGGSHEVGVVFELSLVGTSWTEKVLYSFSGGTGGGNPEGGVIMDQAGNLYGTNSSGVFEISPSGGVWTEKVIYDPGVAKGETAPGLTMDAAGNIFGVVDSRVFELSPNGSGGWNTTVINTVAARIQPDTVIFDKAGNLYGMTAGGGANNCGRVDKLSLGKTGKWTQKILYSFQCSNGSFPLGNL